MIKREWLDIGLGAQEKRLQRGEEPRRGKAHRASLAQKEVDIYLGACEATYPLMVGKASSAQADWEVLLPADDCGLTQLALPRLFCSRGHLRREERKGYFIEWRRESSHFSISPVPTVCTHGTDFVQTLHYLYRWVPFCVFPVSQETTYASNTPPSPLGA